MVLLDAPLPVDQPEHTGAAAAPGPALSSSSSNEACLPSAATVMLRSTLVYVQPRPFVEMRLGVGLNCATVQRSLASVPMKTPLARTEKYSSNCALAAA